MENQLKVFETEAEFFNAMAHPSRLKILELLRDGEACVCHIQAMLDQRQAYISQQLNVLRQTGLVTHRKDGQRIYYQISDPILFSMLDNVKEILHVLGKWEPEIADDANLSDRKKSCTCPQCSAQVAISLEANNA
jgi:DNA-binding transcriptional ArsR family regulator